MSNYLDIDFLRSLDTKLFYFGLGFIQMKLDDTNRIHFWHPKFEPLEPEEVHNHRYNFVSKILAGEMVHETWGWSTTPKDWKAIFTENGGGFTHELVEVSCKPDSHEEPKFCGEGFSKITGSYTLNAGSTYWFEGSQFHRTKTSGAITFLAREAIVAEKALVIRPKGNQGSCPFSVKMTDEEIWQYIDETIRLTR